jgi:hypothetical protein
MDGIHNVYREGTSFVTRYYLPKNTMELIMIAAYFAITFYVTDYFINFRLFKWIYMGTAIILVASWYRGRADTAGKPSPFQLGAIPLPL